MGIEDLNSFIKQNPDFSKSHKLHDTTVIIDGSNLIYYLYYKYNLDFRYGGEYERYYDCAKRFMSIFFECNIKPIVIFEGGQEKSLRKLNSLYKRANFKLECVQYIARGQDCPYPVFPLLVYEVFYTVLSDLGIPLANCDYAAEGQVAVLGNYYDCPIISSNSDFYIFDAHKGFIQLDTIDTAIHLDIDSNGKEYKFLNSKIYYIDEFVKAFPGLDKNIVPLFGTLIEDEFVNSKTLVNFFASIQLPQYGCLSFDLRHKKIVALLCWLQNKTLNEAVNEVTSYFENSIQKYIKPIIEISVCRYKLNPRSLIFIFDKNFLNNPRSDLHSKSMLITPCGYQLPQNFVLKFHQGYISSFCINVIVHHRVFLQEKVEDMELNCSHSCSSYIRRILYGILVRHDMNGTDCRNEKCTGYIKEYDRHGNSIQREIIMPLFELEGIGLLPKVNEVYCIGEEKCIAIIATALGVDSDFFLHIPDAWQLFIGSINHWLRFSGCRSDDFISAVLLNLIYFGLIKCNNPFRNQNVCPKKLTTSGKCTCSSIACIAENVSDSDLKYAEEKLKEYYTNPTLKSGRRPFLNIVHSFNQLQSCLLYITFLNQLLNGVLKNPVPQNCFSGTMLYNLTEAIASCHFPELFIEKVLGKDLELLFTHLKSKVCENIPQFNIATNFETRHNFK